MTWGNDCLFYELSLMWLGWLYTWPYITIHMNIYSYIYICICIHFFWRLHDINFVMDLQPADLYTFIIICKSNYLCLHHSAANGGWSSWAVSTSWSSSCGYATRTLTRSCTNPTPSCGGAPCSGSSTSTETNCCIGAYSSWVCIDLDLLSKDWILLT